MQELQTVRRAASQNRLRHFRIRHSKVTTSADNFARIAREPGLAAPMRVWQSRLHAS